MKRGWIPPLSPFGLLQESLWPNEWFILVACLLLNRTSRKQVEKVLPVFVQKWPTPGALLAADEREVSELCKPLGFAQRRTSNLFKLAERFVVGDWTRAAELPGVGAYGERAHEIFCEGKLGDEPPSDYALVQYYWWAKENSVNCRC